MEAMMTLDIDLGTASELDIGRIHLAGLGLHQREGFLRFYRRPPSTGKRALQSKVHQIKMELTGGQEFPRNCSLRWESSP